MASPNHSIQYHLALPILELNLKIGCELGRGERAGAAGTPLSEYLFFSVIFYVPLFLLILTGSRYQVKYS